MFAQTGTSSKSGCHGAMGRVRMVSMVNIVVDGIGMSTGRGTCFAERMIGAHVGNGKSIVFFSLNHQNFNQVDWDSSDVDVNSENTCGRLEWNPSLKVCR